MGSFQDDLPLLIVAWFFTDFIPAVVAASPKRHGFVVYRLTRYLPAALLGAHSLVAARERDQRLKRSIHRIVVNDNELLAYLLHCRNMGWNPEQGVVVGLVHRAFRGAWEAAGHPGLIHRRSGKVAPQVRHGLPPDSAIPYRDPTNVLDEYLYRGQWQTLKASVRESRRGRPAVWKLTYDWWQRAYLGEPGAAAKEFLLT